MRIISGNLKGKKLFFLEASKTRPLKDMVKESIFNIITHSNLISVEINNSEILDLYSGTGSFGIECISRNAKKVTFVEKELEAAEILKKNINFLSIKNKSLIYQGSVERFLNQHNLENRFNIFFLDPPFSDNYIFRDLNLIKKIINFKKDHLIIVHLEKNSKTNLDGVLDKILVKNYGRSQIVFGKLV
jgi:16S rRNA (guanine966-N2)-methyltransferase